MTRRHDYVSFLSDGRGRGRDFAGFERSVGPGRLVVPLLAVAFIAVSVYWFGFRDADADVGGVLTMEDATIPTLLLPSGAATDDASLLLSGVSIDCHTEIVEWPTQQGGPERAGCVDAPVITNPKIVWRVEVGISGWLNGPIIANNTIFVASAGVAQGQQDRRDGVYALDLYSGEQKWFFGATLDVNGISYGNGIVVATSDEGRVWGIGAADGTLVWEESLEVATFGSPLIVGDLVVIGDADGIVTAFDVRTGTRRWQRSVDGPVRGGAASDGEIIIVAGENRDVLALDLSGKEVWRTELLARGPSGDVARIWAAPTIAGDLVVFTMLREDVFAEPAIAALDKNTGELAWRAIDVAGIKPSDWGNIRSSVAWVGDLLVYGEPYSNKVVALDVASGETMWGIEAGAYCFPHWPSPAVVSGQVVMARHDGGLYGVSVEDENVVWSIYLGNLAAGTAGTFPANFSVDFCEWGPEDSYSILASPAIAPNGYIIIGTLEGYLVAVADRSWG